MTNNPPADIGIDSNILNANNTDHTTNTAFPQNKENENPNYTSVPPRNSSHSCPIHSRALSNAALGLTERPNLSICSSSSSDGPNSLMLNRAALGLTKSASLNIESDSWETVIWSGSESSTSPTSSETFCEYLRQKQWEKDIREEAEYQVDIDHVQEELVKALSYLGDGWLLRKHPPNNELHPPIVRQPTDKAASQWMVAPPPPAKVMDRMCSEDSGSLPSRRPTPSNNSLRASHDQTSSSALLQLVQEALSNARDGSASSKGDSVCPGPPLSPIGRNLDLPDATPKLPQRPGNCNFFFPGI